MLENVCFWQYPVVAAVVLLAAWFLCNARFSVMVPNLTSMTW